MLTDVAIPGERIVIKKEVKKILKHKDLTTEIQCVCVCVCVWNVKTKVIPVIIGTNGTITESFRYQRTTENCHIGQCTHTWEGPT